jgi:hypothetical protein
VAHGFTSVPTIVWLATPQSMLGRPSEDVWKYLI